MLFRSIQLDGTNMKLVMGGTVDAATGAWSPGDTCDIETPITIECGSGHTIEIERAKLSGSFANAINRKGVLGYKCKIQVLQPTDATKKAITITPPQAGS